MPSLCLGTVQFGANYGVTNVSGKVNSSDVKLILDLAQKANIQYLDTAQGYGDAEKVIGSHTRGSSFWKVTTKLLPQKKSFFEASDVDSWNQHLNVSCQNLGSTKLYGLLLHSPADLRKKGAGYLIDWLHKLKESGKVKNLGISIYEAKDLDGLDLGLIDIVQLPLSVYDQRLIRDGTIDCLVKRKIKIQARSIYLQGLLVNTIDMWPDWVHDSSVSHHQKFCSYAASLGLSLLSLSLEYIKGLDFLESAAIGVCNLLEIQQLIQSWHSDTPNSQINWEEWSLNDARLLDPRTWPRCNNVR